MLSDSSKTHAAKRSWHLTLFPLLLLFVLVAVSFFVARKVADQERAEYTSQFNTTSIQTAQLLQEKVQRFPQLLKSTRGMVINRDYRPSGQDWQRFFSSLNLDYRAQGIIGITFTEYVDSANRAAFLERNRQLYGPQFDIFPRSARDENYVIMQAVPDSVSEKIRGYDISSEIRRYEAAQYAKNSGQIAISNPISLLPTDQYSLDYLMLAPVYANAEQPDSGLFLDSDLAFSGWITIGFSLSQLIEQTVAYLDEPLRLQIHDPRSPAGTINYDSNPGEYSESQLSLRGTHTLTIGDEPLELVIMPANGSSQLASMPPYNYAVLLVSLLTSVLAAISLRQLLTARQSALQLAARMVERSKETNFRYQALFEQSPEAIIIHINRGIVLCNRSALELLNAENPADIIGRDVLELVPADARPLVEARLKQQTQRNKPIEQRLSRLDGSTFLAEVSSSQISYDGQPGIQLMFRDITAVKERRNRARIAQRVLEHTSESIMVTDLKGVIVMTNPAFSDLTGYSQDDALGESPALLASGHHDKAFFSHIWQSLVNSGSWLGEIVNRRKNGEIYIQQTNISAVYDKYGDISHFVCLMGDITEQKKTMDSMRFQAMHDSLTRLPNRTHFEARAEDALRKAHQNGQLLGVLFVDLDGFKPINDCWGHSVGDKLLVAAAERLRDTVATSHTLARIGGDEFLVLAESLSDEHEATMLGQRILESLSTPFEIDDIEIRISASIGVSIFPLHGKNIGTLIDAADKAMYRAKHLGKSRVVLTESSRPHITAGPL